MNLLRHPGLLIGAILSVVIFLLAMLDLMAPPPLERAADVSVIVTDREGRWLHGFTNTDGRWRFAVSLKDIDDSYIERLIAVEDERFWHHPGVDGWAILRAMTNAVKSGRVVSGASTITMQTARLLEPRPRVFSSKLIEMIRAIQIERRLTKREILELYLTLAPYGGNIEGIRAASLIYFGKEPTELTLGEQSLLIALPQAPEARRPDLNPAAARTARANVLQKLEAKGKADHANAEPAGGEPLPRRRRVFPRNAYHFAHGVSGSLSAKTSEIRSSLDLRVQARVEAIIGAYADQLTDNATMAIVVVDNRTSSIRALVGSRGVETPGGWIDLTTATRSPGSLLKPFIYGLALQDGAIRPDSVLTDRPRRFGDYQPENFDRTFRGDVRVREALQHSLNLPAVAALDQIGATRFDALLRLAGAPLIRKDQNRDDASLALALGGGGLTLRDVATLYAGLANEGRVRPLQVTEEDDDTPTAFQLVSTPQARRITAILQGTPSLEGRVPAWLSKGAPSIAYKTGTSYGYRDAWAAGYTKCWTVAVWVGRADGAPRSRETGRRAAAPILFDVFDALEKNNDAQAIDPFQTQETRIVTSTQSDTSETTTLNISFPPPGAELFMDHHSLQRGIRLRAGGGSGDYRWYLDGEPISDQFSNTAPLWRPTHAGFYRLTVVDANGQSVTRSVRIHGDRS